MNKKFLYSGLCVVLVGTVALRGADASQTAAGGHAGHYQKCAEECSACQRSCDACAAHCAHLLAQGKKGHLVTLQTCQDCATHCSAAASIVARQGPFADLICKACAEACTRCARECSKYGDDTHMQACAAACRKCEEACKGMLAHTGASASK